MSMPVSDKANILLFWELFLKIQINSKFDETSLSPPQKLLQLILRNPIELPYEFGR
jgi:hypothetical protein